jgi:polar amino acid transport system substrate-binding protein
MRRHAAATPIAALAAVAAMALSACSAKSSTAGGPPTSSGAPAATTPAAAGAGTSAVATSGASTGPRSGTPATTSAAASCAPASLKTTKAGKLTVATDSPAYEPWFSANKPANGKGFESAVAYAVAKQLGYSPAQVSWVHASFNSVIAPTPKKFDFDINEVSITAARKKAVDFSPGYYDVAQAVIALKADKFATATGIDALHTAKLGAQAGTTSLDAIKNQIKPAGSVREYPTNDLAVQALKNGQIDALVVDLPTALYLTGAEIDNSTIIGQLPVVGTPEKFGLVLAKGSPLTTCISSAVTALQNDGTLNTLQAKWLTTTAGAPVLH